MAKTLSPCCNARIVAALADGVLVGSCRKCGSNVCRQNPRTGLPEWLDGESPWAEKELRVMEGWQGSHTNKVVVGLVGEKGSGKGTFVRVLAQLASGKKAKTIQTFRSGELLARVLKGLGIPSSRENMQNLAIELRKTFGDTVITDAMRKQIAESGADIVVFDGMRWLPDAAMLREFAKNVLISIRADSRIRYERTKARKEKVGEEMASYKEFMREERAATEVDIPKIAAMADFEIENNSTVQDFEQQVKELFDRQMFAP